MLHDIPADELRVGMYVVGFDRAWLDVPFWRRRFAVSNEAALRRVLDSGVTRVVVDDARGPAPVRPVPAAPDAAPDPSCPAVLTERRPRRRPRFVDETERARETVERSKAAVRRMFAEARMGRAVDLDGAAPLVDEIAASVARDRSAILSVTRLKSKNEYTYLHSVAVCALMMNLARQLGMTEEEVRQAGMGGLLHDIGKTAVPDAVLEKPGRLDEAEQRAVRSHPAAGHRLLARSPAVSAVALDVCLHHHERIDGRGYPFGLTGGELSVFARMAAICDVYDAVTSDRPYKAPWTPADALARMASWEGHFDPRLLRAFVAGIGIYPLGALVRLSSNRLGVVLSDDPVRPGAPTVRAFYAVEDARAVPVEDVMARNGGGGDPVLRQEVPGYWFEADWTALSDAVRAVRPGERLAVRARARVA